jgi:hypothetical protein
MCPDSQRLCLPHGTAAPVTAPADPYSYCHADSTTHRNACSEPDEGANAEPITAPHLNANSHPYPNPDTNPGRLLRCFCLRS